VDVPAVLAKLAEKLPAYMIPRDIELLPALPVTGNGKVDYRTLARERSEHAAR
jgi:pyochelin synthetase